MTLISIICSLALEYFLGALDRIRDFAWVESWSGWLEQRCAGRGFWEGPEGVLLTIAGPVLALALLALLLEQNHFLFNFLLATVVLIHTLGPELNAVLDRYVAALQSHDEAGLSGLEQSLQVSGVAGEEEGERMMRSILVRSHDHLFGILFWFIVLGMCGALLYRLAAQLRLRCTGRGGGYADAVRRLCAILMWPSARLQALGFALMGDLVSALERWRKVSADPLADSEQIIGSVGLGALRYGATEPHDETTRFADWVIEAQALINRTLIVWLTILGVMTIPGWLA
jgi:membrane protein required for beta-lactamase induction